MKYRKTCTNCCNSKCHWGEYDKDDLEVARLIREKDEGKKRV